MRFHRLSPVFLGGALLFGCSEATPPPHAVPPKPTATASSAEKPGAHCVVQGVVSTESRAPIEGALVAAILATADAPSAVAHSDRQGWYCFPSLDGGSYGFTITAPGQTAAYIDVREVAPSAPDATKIDVQMGGPGFTLVGLVADEKGAPLPGARVQVARLSTFLADLFIVEAGQDGRYAVKLSAASYAPVARSETYTSSPADVELNKDQTADLTARHLNPKGAQAPDDVVAWIKQKAVPLKSTEVGRGFDDMEPLKAIVGGARLVALGEATHGTHEFFQLKHRMLELLVEKMGFRSFGIEASFGDCLPLSEYVRTGKGDPAAALANQGFWVWDTEEVLALVKWMRAYNEDQGHKDKLSLWGFDMQSPASSARAALAYLQKVDPAFALEIGSGLDPINDDFSVNRLELRPAGVRAAVAELATKIAAKLDAERGKYAKKTSERELLLARIHARVLVADTLLAQSGDANVRDRSMADIAAALLEVEDLAVSGKGAGGAGAKMVLWAHNGHVTKHDSGGLPSMGSHLVKRFGAGYVAFGFSFDEGSFQAIDSSKEERGLLSFTLPSAPPGSLDHTLARAGIPLFALDLRGAPRGPVADWLSLASYSRSIGSIFDERAAEHALYTMVPAEHFDALLFVQKTTTARANETGKIRGDDDAKKVPPTALPDPGFESAKKGEPPPGWRVSTRPRQLGYRATVSDSKCASGKQCLVFERTKGDSFTGFSVLTTAIDATPRRGHKVRVSASVRVEGQDPGVKAFLVAFTRDESAVWAQAPGASWKRAQVDLDVPADADRLWIQLIVTGAARAGIDDIEVSAAPNH